MKSGYDLDCCATITAMLHNVPACCPRHHRNDPRAMRLSVCIIAYLTHGEMPGRDILPCDEMERFFYLEFLPKLEAMSQTPEEVQTLLRMLTS